jgi:hypothetical protein
MVPAAAVKQTCETHDAIAPRDDQASAVAVVPSVPLHLSACARFGAAVRRPSKRLSQSAIWFQLAKMWLTISKRLIPNDRNFDPKWLIEPPGSAPCPPARLIPNHEHLRGMRLVRPAVLMPDT